MGRPTGPAQLPRDSTATHVRCTGREQTAGSAPPAGLSRASFLAQKRILSARRSETASIDRNGSCEMQSSYPGRDAGGGEGSNGNGGNLAWKVPNFPL